MHRLAFIGKSVTQRGGKRPRGALEWVAEAKVKRVASIYWKTNDRPILQHIPIVDI